MCKDRLAKEQRLIYAVKNNKEDIVKELLENGLNPNIKYKKNNTLLYYACSCSNYVIIELLLKHGADPNSVVTMTKMGSVISCTEMAEMLLKYGLRPDTKMDKYGNSLITYYMKYSHSQEYFNIFNVSETKGFKHSYIEKLVKVYNQDINQPNMYGENVLALVLQNIHTDNMWDNVKLLLSLGAKVEDRHIKKVSSNLETCIELYKHHNAYGNVRSDIKETVDRLRMVLKLLRNNKNSSILLAIAAANQNRRIGKNSIIKEFNVDLLRKVKEALYE